jgi:predicted dehydrogenase
MLREDHLDGVIVSLPTYLHKEAVTKVAEAGKYVFLEKPLARNDAEGRDILRTILRYKAKAMVGYPLRFDSSFIELRNKISSGVIGEVQIAHASNIGSGPLQHRSIESRPHPVPSWYFEKDLTGGGALIDLGVHMVNLLRWYFGNAIDAKAYLGYRFGLSVEDHAVCFLKFRGGIASVIDVGWFSSRPHLTVELFGTLDHVSVHPESSVPRSISIAEKLLRRNPRARDPYFREIEHFASCIKRGLEPFPTAEEALNDLEVISLAYKNRLSTDDNPRTD